MKYPKLTSPSESCETILRGIKAYNAEHKIWPSQNAVADRLLSRRLELNDAYAELYERLGQRSQALEVFFDILLSAAAVWNPAQNASARANRMRLKALNEEIAKKATALSRLLDERDDIHNHSGFYSSTYHHPVDLIEEASTSNYIYNSWVKEPLAALRGRFDGKYWPSISDCIQVLACDAENAAVEATDPITEAATEANRSSLADVFKAVFTAVKINGEDHGGFLPSDFLLTDATIASLINCALDLSPNKIVDAAYVKRFRQRERERASKRTVEVWPEGS